MYNHRKVKGTSVHRGQGKQLFAYGSMIPRGIRMPQGGRLGDTYTYFSETKIDIGEECESIELLFNNAMVSGFTVRKER